jgi:1,4-dihydroxy-2-naphthoate octaprenyltransferase
MTPSMRIAAPSGRPSLLRIVVMAVRPATLFVALASVLVGTTAALRGGPIRLDALAMALLSALCIQVGTNLVNDVCDAKTGADSSARIGPTRVVQAGLASARSVTLATYAVFAVAALSGLYLVRLGGWPIALIGIASIASGIAYTAGPFPLGYHGLGDVFVMVFFGPVAVCGTSWVVSERLPQSSMLGSIVVGALATAILVVNNVRDSETDRVVGKRTLVARWGRTFGVVEYAALLALAYASVAGLAVLERSPWLLSPLSTAPVALRLAQTLHRSRDGETLNRTLRRTALLLLVVALLLSAALAIR